MAALRGGAAAVMLMGSLSAFARAQEDFPGGWDSAVGYQTFAAQTVQGAAAGFGANYPGFGGYGISPFGGMSVAFGVVPGSPLDAASPGPLAHGGAPQGQGSFQPPNVGTTARRTTANTVKPLARSSRHAAKKRGRSR